MRWTTVSSDEMADHGSACRPRMVSRKCYTALLYASYCCFDVSMGTLADIMFFTRCPSLSSELSRELYIIQSSTEVI